MNNLNKKTNHTSPVRRLIAGLSLLTVTLAFFSSCLKDDDNPPNGNVEIVAGITTVNASPAPSGTAYDFYTDVNKVNADQRFKYGDQILYKGFYPGSRPFAIFKYGTTTDPVLDTVMTIENNKFFTLFLAGKADQLSFVLLDDGDLAQASTGKAKIRFVNLSPDAPELDLALKGEDTPFVVKKKFKESSDFEEVESGEQQTFVISRNTDHAVLKEITIDAKNGSVYTIWAKGLTTTDDTALQFGADVVDHLESIK